MKTAWWMVKKYRKMSLPLLIVFAAAVLGLSFAAKLFCPNKIFAEAYPIKGIDVSHHQDTVDWAQLPQQGIDFAFIKATEGSGFVDEDFASNWKEAAENNVLAGAYHFFSFDSPGTSQAKLYIDTVGDLSGKLPPVADVEFYADKERNQPSGDDVRRELAEYLQALEAEYSTKPIIYTTYKVYELYLKDAFDDYPLWIRNVYFPPSDKDWTFWQYSDRGKLKGIGGSPDWVDLNVFREDAEALQALTVPPKHK